MKLLVKKVHSPDTIVPLKAMKGEIVIGEERPTQWEGWLYCTNQKGISAWVPKNYLKRVDDHPKSYEFNRSYNSREISVDKGEIVVFKESESSWALIIKADGDEGWIPLENLDYEEKIIKKEKKNKL
jgi:hypothetical protein